VTHVLITGGGGFLGQKLALKLAELGEVGGQAIQSMTLVDVVAPKPVAAAFKTREEVLDVSDPAAVQGLFKDTFDTIYHLAAVVSGQAEAEFDVGLQVNLFGTLNMLQAARMQDARIGRPAKFIYASSASSFMSSIFRDTLQGNPANCPLGRDYKVWHTAPRTIIENLVHAALVPAEAFGMNRNINLPGRSDTIGDMIGAMTRVAGPQAQALITWEPDEAVANIALGWRGNIRHDKALALGFKAVRSFEDTVKWFLEDDIAT